MTSIRIASVTMVSLIFGAQFTALGQSVVSTHSGIVYFFAGSVYLGDEPLEQKFGKFPDIGEGRILRTAEGRAEVLLTPGVFLRLGENSTVRMLSNKLADTRVELLQGSAIVESNDAGKDTSVTVIHKKWQAKVPQECVFRLDAAPPQLRVYKGEVKVTTEDQKDVIAVESGEMLPFAAVLLTERSSVPEGDDFKTWAMARSQAISSDNATAAEIVDDPNKFDTSVDLGSGAYAGLNGGLGGGYGYGGFTYYPPAGLSAMGLTNPYGLSFWSPYQSMLAQIYIPTYFYGAVYGPVHSGWPIGIGVHTYRGGPIGGITLPIGVGYRPGGFTTPRAPYPSGLRPTTVPRTTIPAGGVHPIGVHPAIHR